MKKIFAIRVFAAALGIALLTGTGFNRLIAVSAEIDDNKTADVVFVFQNKDFFHDVQIPSVV